MIEHNEASHALSWVSDFLNQGCVLASPSPSSGAGPEALWLGFGAPASAGSPEPRALSLLAPDFFLSESAGMSWRIYPAHARLGLADLERSLEAWLSGQAPDSVLGEPAVWSEPSRADFARDFEDLQGRIGRGELKKGVPVAFSRSRMAVTAPQRARWLLQLLRSSRGRPVCVYGFWDGSREGMLGATPELLFDRPEPGRISTMALAGTRPRHSDHRAPLLEDPKELAEHRWVIDGIASALAPLGSVRVGQTRELELPTLSHLLTPIEASVPAQTRTEELLRALHPTPALGAWPREAGQAWLRSISSAPVRGRFGAPFGAVAPGGEGRFAVAIRNIQWRAEPGAGIRDEAQVLLGAGCGVVRESELEREWAEVLTKMDSVRRFIGL